MIVIYIIQNIHNAFVRIEQQANGAKVSFHGKDFYSTQTDYQNLRREILEKLEEQQPKQATN